MSVWPVEMGLFPPPPPPIVIITPPPYSFPSLPNFGSLSPPLLPSNLPFVLSVRASRNFGGETSIRRRLPPPLPLPPLPFPFALMLPPRGGRGKECECEQCLRSLISDNRIKTPRGNSPPLPPLAPPSQFVIHPTSLHTVSPFPLISLTVSSSP